MISGLFTILAMLAFGYAVWWAYGRSNRDDFNRVAQMPLDDDEDRS